MTQKVRFPCSLQVKICRFPTTVSPARTRTPVRIISGQTEVWQRDCARNACPQSEPGGNTNNNYTIIQHTIT
eukprot:2838322-Heterocapsa_arctica.AAC.1